MLFGFGEGIYGVQTELTAENGRNDRNDKTNDETRKNTKTV